MHLVLHLIKQELLAHRGLFSGWALVQAAIAVFGITGLAGEFYRAQTSLITEQILGLLEVLHAVGIVLLPGAVALADPPTDECGHWRALPVRSWHLFTSKLATVLVAVVLPILCAQTVSLVCAGAGQWTAHMLLDQLGHLPSWIGVGFCFGASAGNWKRFAIAVASLLVGTTLLMFVAEAVSNDAFAAGPFQIFLMQVENGLDNLFINNLFALGAGVAILLRYFTRIRGELLALLFVLGIPATALIAPRLFDSFIPAYRPPIGADRAQIQVSYDLPKRIVVVTNRAGVRWHGLADYSALHFQGVEPSRFILPTKLDTHLWTHNEERTSFSAIGQDWFRFAGTDSPQPWDLDAMHFLERHIALSNAVPGMRVINPPFEPGDGFRLFDLEEHMAVRNSNALMRLTTQLHISVGNYEKVGEIPLRVGASLSANGTGIRVAALLLDRNDKTQIKLNIRHVRFVTEEDSVHVRKYIDPRRSPRNLRYILVNGPRGEACLPTNREWTERPAPQPLAFQTTVLDYSIADGPETDRPIAREWLESAQLHVFRAMTGRQLVLSNTIENVKLFDIPREPLPQHIEPRYR